MATISKTVRYDLTAGDHLTGPMTQAAKAMDIASRNARALDRALASQRKAADVSAGASLALARADKILGEAEDELSGKAALARRELERQGLAAETAARKQEAAAARSKKLTAVLGRAGAGGGLLAAGSVALAAAGPLGAATAAIGAFGAVAIPELSKVHDALGKTGKAGQQAWAQLTPPERQLGGALRTVQSSFGKLSATLAPVVDRVVTLGAKTLTDLMPALGTLARAGGSVLTSFLKPLDAFARSKAFAQIIGQLSSFAVQAGKIVGPAVIQLVSELLTLFVKVMPAGIKILNVLLPTINLMVTDLTPVIVAIADIAAATLTWLQKTHLLIPALAALGIAITLAGGPVSALVAGVALLVVGIVELVKHWRQIWHEILVITMDVWHWIQAHWPLLLGIITGPVGLAILWIVRHFGDITKAVRTVLGDVSRVWNSVWNTLKAAFRVWVVTGILTPLGWIIHGAASAFGWVPGLGGKLKTAARQFDQFKASVNKALGGINGRTVHVSVAMTSSTNPYPGGISGRKAAGGKITGPGGPRDDRAGLYALSNNEWVIRADSSARYGHAAMAAVNEGRAFIGYAGGGVAVQGSAPGYAAITSSLTGPLTKLAIAFAKAAVAAAASSGGVSGAGPVGGDSGANRALARQMFPWPASQWNAFNTLEMHEAGYNRFARNGSSGAYGIPQALPESKMPFAAQAAGGSHAGPQLSWMFSYIAQRYGTPANAWAKYYAHPGGVGWYDQGGYLPPGLSLAYNGTGRPEPVGPAASGGNTYNITVNVPPNASRAATGAAIVECIRAHERGSGPGWRK